MGCCRKLLCWRKPKKHLEDSISEKPEPKTQPIRNSAPVSQPTTAFQPAPRLVYTKASIWNKAYDEVLATETKLAQRYEEIIKKISNFESDESLSAGDDANISQRKLLMDKAIETGLDRADREAEITNRPDEALRLTKSIREFVSKVIVHSPEASVAWGGVCLTSEVLSNATSRFAAQRDGIIHITAKMGWYWDLTDMLSSAGKSPSGFAIQKQMEADIVKIYARILSFQMRCVYMLHKNRLLASLEDLITYDDWAKRFEDINKAESDFQKQYAQFATEQRDQTWSKMIQLALEALAQQRTHNGDREDERCRDLIRGADPSIAKQNILNGVGAPLAYCCEWIYECPKFHEWLKSDPSEAEQPQKVLWITGEAGKGKTMLLCNLIKSFENCFSLGYFFCVGTDASLRTEVAILQGLIWEITQRIPALLSHVRDREDQLKLGGKYKMTALCETLKSMIEDPLMEDGILIIDALDECSDDLKRILELIMSTSSSRCRWILTSRAYSWISTGSKDKTDVLRLDMEDDIPQEAMEKSIGKFITNKLYGIKSLEQGSEEFQRVKDEITSRANGSYLWVTLVLEEIQRMLDGKYLRVSASDFIIEKIQGGLVDLDKIYAAMMKRIIDDEIDSDFCTTILRFVFIAERPLRLQEIQRLIGNKEVDVVSIEHLRKLIVQGISFLKVNETVSFIHQSARDYIHQQQYLKSVPLGMTEDDMAQAHFGIFKGSIEMLCQTLKKNIYQLGDTTHWGANNVRPDPDPLLPVAYSCTNWVHHLIASRASSDDEGIHVLICDFLREHILHWIEAFVLLGETFAGINALEQLKKWLGMHQRSQDILQTLVTESHRIFLTFRPAVEKIPLQIYASPLVFAPSCSVIKRMHEKEIIASVKSARGVKTNWNQYSTILEHPGKRMEPNWMAWQDNSTLTTLATSGSESIATLWNVKTGDCLQQRRLDSIDSDSRYTSINGNACAWINKSLGRVQYWDFSPRDIQTVDVKVDYSASMVMSSDGRYLLVHTFNEYGSSSSTLTIYDMHRQAGATGLVTSVKTVQHKNFIDVAFITDTVFATVCDSTLHIEDVNGDQVIEQQCKPGQRLTSIVPSHGNSPQFAVMGSDQDIYFAEIWDATKAECVRVFKSSSVSSSMHPAMQSAYQVCPSGDSSTLAVVPRHDYEPVEIWHSLAAFEPSIKIPRDGYTKNITLSRDGCRVASSSTFLDHICVWDAVSGAPLAKLQSSNHSSHLLLSPDGTRLVSTDDTQSVSKDGSTVTVWELTDVLDVNDTVLDDVYATRKENAYNTSQPILNSSPDGRKLCTLNKDDGMTLWDLSDGSHHVISIQRSPPGRYPDTVFAPDGNWLAVRGYKTLEIWRLDSAAPQRLFGHGVDELGKCAVFSSDSRLVAWVFNSKLHIWDIETGMLVPQTEPRLIKAAAFLRGDDTLALLCNDGSICIAGIIGKLGTHDHALLIETFHSGNNEFLVSACQENIKVWNVTDRTNAVCVETISGFGTTGWPLLRRIPGTDSMFYTDRGVVDLDPASLASLLAERPQDSVTKYFGCGYKLSPDMEWILKDGVELLWLPPDYRPRHDRDIVVWGSCIAIACRTQRLLILEFLRQ